MEKNVENTVDRNRKSERLRNRVDLGNTLNLAIVTVAMTWCSYQSNLWHGLQTFLLADSNKFNRLANQEILKLGQRKDMDVAIMMDFTDAVFEKKEEKTDYILSSVRPELRKLLTEWMDTWNDLSDSTTYHPLLMEQYLDISRPHQQAYDDLKKKADLSDELADKASRNADNYSLLTVICSMVMFLGAIATKSSRFQLSIGLTLASAIICMAILAVLYFYMPLAPK